MAHRFKIGGRDLVIISRKRERPKWSKEYMLQAAAARDNGGTWYLAKSAKTVKDLERLFRQREVASLLEETVGGIVGGFDITNPREIRIQLSYDRPSDLDLILLCLEEVGIEILDLLPQRETEVRDDEC